VTPYYADDSVTLYHGDCREVLAWLEADVVVTDPPYGQAYRSRAQKGWSTYNPTQTVTNDEDTTVRDAAIALWGDARPAVVFGTWRVPKPQGVRGTLIWDKGDVPGMGSMYLPWGTSHEEIYLLGQSLKEGIGWQRAGGRSGSIIRDTTCMGNPHGLVAQTGHPTPKPLSLMEALIRQVPTGVIADPFAGSGSTLVAAKHLGRRAIGVELEERYCEIAAKRLCQDTLFGGAS
jgi:site-specific DNA-methyltransferase (adenine-specific)